MPSPSLKFDAPPEKIRRLQELQRELARRQHEEQFALRDDPVGWVEKHLGEHVWSKQAEVMRAVVKHKRVAVRSGHAVGKSFLASRLVSYWLSVHEPNDAFVVTCYTDDTEILTREGWKFFRDVKTGTNGDMFATRNPDTKKFEWQHATHYHEAPWDGEVVDVKGRSVDMRVTPNHRMLVQWKDHAAGTSGEILKPAEKISQRGAEIPAKSEWHAECVLPLRFGKFEWDSVTFASFLGAWLADGGLGPPYVRKSEGRLAPAGSITITRPPGTKGYEPYRELLTKMLGREPRFDQEKTWTFRCAELWHYLSPLCGAANKYIPADVKNWGRPELDALLSYYLLGDGWSQNTTAGRPAWRACTVSRRLADDLQEIAQKVDLAATIKIRPARDGGTFEGGRQIRAENCLPCYYLFFNTSQCRSVHVSRSQYKGKVYCVSVPNEVLYVRRNGTPIWCGNSAPTFAQVRAILWRYIRQAHRKGNLPGRVNQTEWHIGDDLVGFGRKPADETSMQGLHSHRLLAILDEAAGVEERFWVAVDSLATGDECRILAIGNPDNSASHFARVCAPASPWHKIAISAFDTPNFTGEEVPSDLKKLLVSASWVEEKRREWGEDNPIYRSKVLGEFSTDDPGKVVRGSDVAACRIAPVDPWPANFMEPIELGVDVGGGGDETVVRERRGRVAGREWREFSDQPSTIAPMVLRAIHDTGAQAVKIDEIGVGRGVIGELENMAKEGRHSARIVAVNVAARASNPERFENIRAEIWWDIGRLHSQDRLWDLSSMDNADTTVAQLLEPRWDVGPGGRIRIEKKDEVRKRLHRSPDNADALLLAYYGAPLSPTPRVRWLETPSRGYVASRW